MRIGNQTVTFTPDGGQCGKITTMDIVVTNSVTPVFSQIGPLCETDLPVLLPLTDVNGITGSWNIVSFDPASGSGPITFTPDAGQCGVPTDMNIVVTSTTVPVFSQIGPFCETDAAVLLPTTDAMA